MTHTYIEDVGKHVGEEVTLRGWVHNKRSSGKIQFLIVRDGTGYIQGVVVKNAVSPEVFEIADSLTHESSVIVTGKVREDSRAKRVRDGCHRARGGSNCLERRPVPDHAQRTWDRIPDGSSSSLDSIHAA